MTKVYRRTSLPALDNSKSVQNPDLLNLADKNYAATILRYSNLAILYSQLDTKDKHIVGAINEINKKVQPAKRVEETDVVGGVIIGDGLSVTEEGILSANPQGITPATTETLGGIMVGDNLSITPEGRLSATAQELEPATADRLGGVKLGEYLNITEDGTLSVESSAVGKTYYSGQLTTIDNQNKINVNMTKSTPADIEQESRDNPNVLFFTEGDPNTDTRIYTYSQDVYPNDWTVLSYPVLASVALTVPAELDNCSVIISFEYLGYSSEDCLTTLGLRFNAGGSGDLDVKSLSTLYASDIPDDVIRVYFTYWDAKDSDPVIINTLPLGRRGEFIQTLYQDSWDQHTHIYTIMADGDSAGSYVTAYSQQLILPLLANSAENIANNAELARCNIQDAGQYNSGNGVGYIMLYAENLPTRDLQIRVIYNG